MTQPEHVDDRLREGDRTLLRMPIVDHPVTYNEIHAATLCGGVGLVLGERGIGFRTLLREPWWAAGTFAAAYLLGRQLRPADHDPTDP